MNTYRHLSLGLAALLLCVNMYSQQATYPPAAVRVVNKDATDSIPVTVTNAPSTVAVIITNPSLKVEFVAAPTIHVAAAKFEYKVKAYNDPARPLAAGGVQNLINEEARLGWRFMYMENLAPVPHATVSTIYLFFEKQL